MGGVHRLPLDLPLYDSSHQQAQGVGYCHVCPSQYIFRDQGNEYLSEFTDPVDSYFGQDSIYYLAPVCPHSSTEPMMKSLVVRYQCQLGPCLQQSLKCVSIPLPPVNSHKYMTQIPLGKHWGNHYALQGSSYWDPVISLVSGHQV